MGVGAAGVNGGSRSSINAREAAARRAAEEARRAAEAARKAAEAARKAAEAAKKAAEAAKKAQAEKQRAAAEAKAKAAQHGQSPEQARKSKAAFEDAAKAEKAANATAAQAQKALQSAEKKVATTSQHAESAMRQANVQAQREGKPAPFGQKGLQGVKNQPMEFATSFEGSSRQAEFEKRLGSPAQGPEAPATSLLTENAQDNQMMVADPAPTAAPKNAPEAKALADDKRKNSTDALQKASKDEKAASHAEDLAADARKKQATAAKELQDAQDARKALADRPAPRPGDAERAKALDKRVKDAKGKLEQATSTAQKTASDAKKARATANDSQHKAVEASKTALQAAKDANAKAKESGQPAPYPAADKVQDVLDVQGQLSPEEQTALLGAPMVKTPEGTARADMKVLQCDGSQPKGYDPDFEKKFDAMKEKLHSNPDPAYQKELLRLAQPWIQNNISTDIGRVDSAPYRARKFGEMAKGLPDESQKALAQSVASGIHQVGPQEIDLAKAGPYELHLMRALGSKGAPMAKNLALQMMSAREHFNDAKKKVEELNAQLGALASGFSKTMTPQQRTQAINAFKAHHKEEYDNLEKAAKGLSNAVALSGQIENDKTDLLPKTSPSLKGEAAKVIKELGAFANTDAGQKLIEQEVAKQSVGEPSALDGISSFLGSAEAVKVMGKDVLGDISKGLTVAVTKSLAGMVLDDVVAGNDPENASAKKRFRDVLSKNAALFGLDPQGEELSHLQSAFDDLLEGKEGATEKFQTAIRTLEPQAAGAAGTSLPAASLRGLAVVAGFIGVAKDGSEIAKKFTSDDGQGIDQARMAGDLAKLLGDGVSTSGDGAVLAIDVLNKLKGETEILGRTSAVLGKAGPVGGLIAAVGDTIGAVNAARDGNKLEFASKSMTAAGGAILAVAAMSNAVPVAGQIMAGVLLAAGTGLNLYQNYRDGKLKEQDTKAFLEAAGMPHNLVEKIKNPETAAKTGQFLSQLAERTKMSPEQLQLKLSQLNEAQLDTLLKAVDKTKMDKNGFVESDHDGGAYKTFHSPLRAEDPRAIQDKLGSMDDAHNYLFRNGVLVDTDLSGARRAA